MIILKRHRFTIICVRDQLNINELTTQELDKKKSRQQK